MSSFEIARLISNLFLAKSAMAFQSGQNQAQRQMLQDQAARATAMGGMQAQRMAAQQGMGGSGLLQQAQA